MSAGFAAIFSARLPNPLYASATAGVEIKVLKWKVKKSFTVELGNKCVFQAPPGQGLGMDLIVGISPDDNAKKLPTDTKIRVEFALPIMDEFNLPKLNGEGDDIYKASIASIVIKNKSGVILGHRVEFDEKGTLANIIPDYFFNSNDSISVAIKLIVKKNGVFEGQEIKTLSFTTGTSPNIIPTTNVEYTYPSEGMKNYYKKEYNKYNGMIKLNQGMPELIYGTPEGKVQNIRFTDLTTGDKKIVAFEYKPLDRMIVFPMDYNNFVNNHEYKVEVLRYDDGSYSVLPPSSETHPSTNLKGVGNNLFGANGSNNNKPTDNLDEIIYSFKFRVSNYNTFVEKVKSGVKNGTMYEMQIEKFDQIEINQYITENFISEHYEMFKNVKIDVQGRDNRSIENDYFNCDDVYENVLANDTYKGTIIKENLYKENLLNVFNDLSDKYRKIKGNEMFINNAKLKCKEIGFNKNYLTIRMLSFVDDLDILNAAYFSNHTMTYTLPNGQKTSTLNITY